MATLREKIDCEQKTRALLDEQGLPQPDDVEYGYTCIRLFWRESKACVIVQIDEPPEGWVFAEDLPVAAADGDQPPGGLGMEPEGGMP